MAPTRAADAPARQGGLAGLDQDLERVLLSVASASELLEKAPGLADPRRVLEGIAASVQDDLRFERVAVWRWDSLSRSFVGVHCAGVSPRLIRSLRIPFAPALPLAASVIEDGRWQGPWTGGTETRLGALAREIYAGLGQPPAPCLLAPLQSTGRGRCFRLRPDPAGCRKSEAGPFAGLSVKLASEDIASACPACPVFPVAGLIWADGGPGGTVKEEESIRLGLTLAQADLLLEAATMLEALARASDASGSGGVCDETEFRRMLVTEVDRSVRFGHSSALVLLGLEDLTPGDESCRVEARLARIADLLVATVRRLDRIGRTGPQEMAFILPHVGADEAARAVERLRDRLRECADWDRASGFPAGIAVSPADARGSEELLGLARYALHRARSTGDARTHVFGRGHGGAEIERGED